MKKRAMGKRVICEQCGKVIPTADLYYMIKIDMYAGPNDLVIDEDNLNQDYIEEIEKLLIDMQDADVEEVNDQIYETYSFEICPKCRDLIHKQLKQKKQLKNH